MSVVVVVIVVVVISTKIARSRDLGIYACCKHNKSVDISEKQVSMCSQCGSQMLQIVHYPFSMPVVY